MTPAIPVPVDVHSDKRHVIVVDCLASTCVERLVSKSSLIGYQYDLILKLLESGTIDRETAAFILSLVYFADWDDYDRESYMWTHSPVIKMIRSPAQWREWRTRVMNHESSTFLNKLFAMKKSKLFCFFLCVDLLALEEEIVSLVEILNPVMSQGGGGEGWGEGEGGAVGSDYSSSQLIPLSAPHSILLDLMREVKILTPNGLNSTFRRVSCRVGSSFQVEIPPLDSFPSAPLPLKPDSELKYHPNHSLSNTELDMFLISAKKLIPIQSGYLIDSTKPTISTSTMDTSLVLPTFTLDESLESIENKIKSYDSHLKQLAMSHKLKPSLGLWDAHSPTTSHQKPLSGSLIPSIPASMQSSSSSSSSMTLAQPLPPRPPPAAPPTSILVKAPLDPSPFQVPLCDCRPKYYWDDALLEILHFSNYDTRSAFHHLERLVSNLANSSSSHAPSMLRQYFNMSRWSAEALQIFFESIRFVILLLSIPFPNLSLAHCSLSPLCVTTLSLSVGTLLVLTHATLERSRMPYESLNKRIPQSITL
jgi:hypothetical protein